MIPLTLFDTIRSCFIFSELRQATKPLQQVTDVLITPPSVRLRRLATGTLRVLEKVSEVLATELSGEHLVDRLRDDRLTNELAVAKSGVAVANRDLTLLARNVRPHSDTVSTTEQLEQLQRWWLLRAGDLLALGVDPQIPHTALGSYQRTTPPQLPRANNQHAYMFLETASLPYPEILETGSLDPSLRPVQYSPEVMEVLQFVGEQCLGKQPIRIDIHC